MKNEDLMRTARRRANAKAGFLIHLLVFVVVNTLLVAINLGTTPHVRWFPFPMAGWALGLAIHGLAVFLSGTDLKEKMIGAELRKLERQRGLEPRNPD